MMYKALSLFFLSLLLNGFLLAQYVLNGAATKNSCNCYTLTPSEAWKSGSVWNSQKINLNNAFDFKFNVFLGCSSSPGADGIVFMLQPNSTSIGASGEGMGFDGIAPSIGITLDTWQNFNLNDPAYDHISIQLNGNVNHNFDLAGPVPASSTSNDIEDCQWHKLRITWDPATKWYRAYFNDVLRVQAQIDLIASVFNNDPFVFWGFSAATGGEWNLQQFCTALNPDFSVLTDDLAGCVGTPVSFKDASESFTNISNYSWKFGDGNTSTLKDPTHIYTQPGTYAVSLRITALDGCSADSTRMVTIGSEPKAEFSVTDACEGKTVNFLHNSDGVALEYKWLLNNTLLTSGISDILKNLSPDNYKLQLIASSTIGCGVEQISESSFTILPKPYIEHSVVNGCVNTDIPLNAFQIDSRTTIKSWNWQVGSGAAFEQQNIVINYAVKGDYSIKTWVQAENGCYSDTLNTIIFINEAFAFAGRDTLILRNTPLNINAAGNGNFTWTPSTGLNNPNIPNPNAILTEDQAYLLTVVTPEGCIATDSLKVEVFKNSAVFVPNAFTPNRDGLNDIFKPIYSGINRLHYFYIYNRWGQVVFKSNNINQGWDGTLSSNDSIPGIYVWILKAEDLEGKIYELKGTVNLIR